MVKWPARIATLSIAGERKALQAGNTYVLLYLCIKKQD